MKSALSLTVTACLATTALTQAAAQDPTPTAGPIHQAISRQAVLLASAQQRKAGDPEWSRVRNLAVGTAIIVALRSSQARKAYVVQVDASDLTVTATKHGPHEKIARVDVVEIRQPPGHPARWGALIGAGVGAAIGAYSLQAGCPRSGGGESVCAIPGPYVVLWAGLGAGTGAGVGALVGSLRDHSHNVIYRAP